jgi:hypothetical protein
MKDKYGTEVRVGTRLRSEGYLIDSNSHIQCVSIHGDLARFAWREDSGAQPLTEDFPMTQRSLLTTEWRVAYDIPSDFNRM